MNEIKIRSVRIIISTGKLLGMVCVEDGKVNKINDKDIDFPYILIVDAKRDYVSPGFIDLHRCGTGIFDFMNGPKLT